MAQKDHPDEGPTLELPSLFRRKKKVPQVDTAESSAVDTEVAEPGPEPVAEPVAEAPIQTTEVLDELVDEPAEEPEPLQPEPVADSIDAAPEVLVEPEDVPTEASVNAPPPPAEPEPLEPEPVPAEAAPVDAVAAEEQPVAAAPPDTEPVLAAPKPPMRDRIEAGLPDLAAGTASIVVGAIVGLLGCVATFLSLKGCELATGTDSCGGPGLLVLIVILVGMIVVGALLLRMFGVAEPGNVSFLGVAITAVVILVFLIKYLFSPWMFAVVPVLSAFAYGLARWVTTRWTDDGDYLKDDYSHDVR